MLKGPAEETVEPVVVLAAPVDHPGAHHVSAQCLGPVGAQHHTLGGHHVSSDHSRLTGRFHVRRELWVGRSRGGGGNRRLVVSLFAFAFASGLRIYGGARLGGGSGATIRVLFPSDGL